MAFSVCVNLKKDPNTSNYYIPDKSTSTATTIATTYIDRRRCGTLTVPFNFNPKFKKLKSQRSDPRAVSVGQLIIQKCFFKKKEGNNTA